MLPLFWHTSKQSGQKVCVWCGGQGGWWLCFIWRDWNLCPITDFQLMENPVQLVHHFSSDWNIATTIGCNTMKFGRHICGGQQMNPSDFVDVLTFHLVPATCCKQVLDELSWKWAQKLMCVMNFCDVLTFQLYKQWQLQPGRATSMVVPHITLCFSFTIP